MQNSDINQEESKRAAAKMNVAGKITIGVTIFSLIAFLIGIVVSLIWVFDTDPIDKVYGKNYLGRNASGDNVTISLSSFTLDRLGGKHPLTYTLHSQGSSQIEHGTLGADIVDDHTFFVPEENASFTVSEDGNTITSSKGSVYSVISH